MEKVKGIPKIAHERDDIPGIPSTVVVLIYTTAVVAGVFAGVGLYYVISDMDWEKILNGD